MAAAPSPAPHTTAPAGAPRPRPAPGSSMLARAPLITAADVAFGVSGGDQANPLEGLLDGELTPAIEALEREMIRRAMTEAGGNRTAAARRLGLHRQLLYAKLKRYDL